jgi:hypothetical protein
MARQPAGLQGRPPLIFEAAQAASSYNEQPWSYIVATLTNRRSMFALYRALWRAPGWAKVSARPALGREPKFA